MPLAEVYLQLATTPSPALIAVLRSDFAFPNAEVTAGLVLPIKIHFSNRFYRNIWGHRDAGKHSRVDAVQCVKRRREALTNLVTSGSWGVLQLEQSFQNGIDAILGIVQSRKCIASRSSDFRVSNE